MPKEVRAYRRSARKKQIIKILQDWHTMDYANEATSYMLADAVDVRPSQKFRDILNEMVGEGILKVEERDQSGRFTTKFYSLVDGAHYHEKFSRRHISVRSRGQVVGQMEMFS